MEIIETPIETPIEPPIEPPIPPVPDGRDNGIKWLVALIIGLVVVTAFFVAVFYSIHADNREVSVVRMEGTMTTGDYSDIDMIGSEYVGKELRDAANDPMTKAIVLRVNSGGGTPAAAQEIIGDLEYAKTKKPVVVSMGDMATSAAYYVSVHADKIYANPDTFTAGVGVMWTFEDVSNWNSNEGYNISIIKSGTKKDMGTTSRPISDEERIYAQKIVNDSFERFISDVTTQRIIARSDIEDGRIIRGADAVKINVVDELGNLNDAIDGARALAASWR